MRKISAEEKREYFREFQYEVLTSKSANRELVNEFVSKKAGNSLETYIRDENKAWSEDSDGETRVYLIKDKFGKIALFFSLKCGLLVGENLDEKLSEDHQAFVEAIIDVKRENDSESIRQLYEAGCSIYGDEVDRLFEIADKRLDTKTEAAEIGQSDNTINVPKCFSAIELRHLCRNEEYVGDQEVGIPLGFGLFWEQIVPIIVEITKKIGCKYLYLYAADNTNQKESDVRKLVEYYKHELKFYECGEGIKFVKPEYDNHCYGLVQEISKLEANREAVWQEFSNI